MQHKQYKIKPAHSNSCTPGHCALFKKMAKDAFDLNASGAKPAWKLSEWKLHRMVKCGKCQGWIADAEIIEMLKACQNKMNKISAGLERALTTDKRKKEAGKKYQDKPEVKIKRAEAQRKRRQEQQKEIDIRVSKGELIRRKDDIGHVTGAKYWGVNYDLYTHNKQGA